MNTSTHQRSLFTETQIFAPLWNDCNLQVYRDYVMNHLHICLLKIKLAITMTAASLFGDTVEFDLSVFLHHCETGIIDELPGL